VWKYINNSYALYSEYFANAGAIWMIGDGIGYSEERKEENMYSQYRMTNETRKYTTFQSD
jgi:alkaline phosphatase